MSFEDFLINRCTIQRKAINTSGKTDTESFTDLATNVRCRLLKNSTTRYNADKAQHATMIRSRVAFLAGQSIAKDDRIILENRAYDVVDVIAASDTSVQRHSVAVCDAVAGDA